jgi:hypothetical protein
VGLPHHIVEVLEARAAGYVPVPRAALPPALAAAAAAWVVVTLAEYAALVAAAAERERPPAEDDGEQAYMWFGLNEPVAAARVPSLCQLRYAHADAADSGDDGDDDDDDDSRDTALVTCAYYARHALAHWATVPAPDVEAAYAALADVAERREAARGPKRPRLVIVDWARDFSSSAVTVPVRAALAPLAIGNRAHFVDWYAAALGDVARHMRLNPDAPADDADVFELAPWQVARAWPDTTLLVVGNDGLDGVAGNAALAAALDDEWPHAARDLARLRALATTAAAPPEPVLVLVAGHWLATLVAVRRDRLLVLVADSLEQRTFVPLAVRALMAAVYR